MIGNEAVYAQTKAKKPEQLETFGYKMDETNESSYLPRDIVRQHWAQNPVVSESDLPTTSKEDHEQSMLDEKRRKINNILTWSIMDEKHRQLADIKVRNLSMNEHSSPFFLSQRERERESLSLTPPHKHTSGSLCHILSVKIEEFNVVVENRNRNAENDGNAFETT